MRPRIVLDTNILISAFGWRGAPFDVLRRAFEEEFQLLISPALIGELQRVLNYPKFRFSDDDIAKFLITITEGAELVLPEIKIDVITADPDDNRILECAVAGCANFIVSGDPHLKELKKFQEIPILRPSEFLEVAGGQ